MGFVVIDPATGWLDQIAVRPKSFGAGIAGTLFALGLAQSNPVFGFGAPLTAMAVIAALGLAASLRIGGVENFSVRR